MNPTVRHEIFCSLGVGRGTIQKIHMSLVHIIHMYEPYGFCSGWDGCVGTLPLFFMQWWRMLTAGAQWFWRCFTWSPVPSNLKKLIWKSWLLVHVMLLCLSIIYYVFYFNFWIVVRKQICSVFVLIFEKLLFF